MRSLFLAGLTAALVGLASCSNGVDVPAGAPSPGGSVNPVNGQRSSGGSGQGH